MCKAKCENQCQKCERKSIKQDNSVFSENNFIQNQSPQDLVKELGIKSPISIKRLKKQDQASKSLDME